MDTCRNCGSSHLKDLGFVGEVAPFFLKRVLNMEVRTARAVHPLRLLARRLCALPQRLFERVYGSSAYVEMQICLDCSFVQTKHAFPDERAGRMRVELRPLGGHRLVLVVSDDGVGLPLDLDLARVDSLGLQLVHDLADQLHGTVEVSRDVGTTFTVTFDQTDSGEIEA